MRQKKTSKPPTVLEELRALELKPPKKINRLLAGHLKCEESLRLSEAVSEAARRSKHNSASPLVVPTEILPPLA